MSPHDTTTSQRHRLYFSFVFLLLCICSRLRAELESPGILEPRFMDKESFAQTYTLTALFYDSDDTTKVQIQFALTNLEISDRNTACKILILPGKGEPLR